MTTTQKPSNLESCIQACLDCLRDCENCSGRGRKRQVELREMVNAILYLNRSGCSWELLPPDFPNYKTVYRYFRSWQKKGVWQQIHDQLRERVRHALVHAANVADVTASRMLLAEASLTQPTIELVWADQGYRGERLQQVATGCELTLEVVQRQHQGFEVLPRRWVVERTFARLGKQRRLSKDYERLPEVSETVVQVAMIPLMLNRLTA